MLGIHKTTQHIIFPETFSQKCKNIWNSIKSQKQTNNPKNKQKEKHIYSCGFFPFIKMERRKNKKWRELKNTEEFYYHTCRTFATTLVLRFYFKNCWFQFCFFKVAWILLLKHKIFYRHTRHWVDLLKFSINIKCL